MKYIEGNLLDLALEGEFDVIIHGCNIFNTFGSGIAREIAERFPAAYEADKLTVAGDRDKLGNCTESLFSSNDGSPFLIVNLYTQGSFGRDGVHVDYKALKRGMKALQMRFNNKQARIGIPKIGAGLGGGDWTQIEAIIDELGFADITCAVFPVTSDVVSE